MSKAFRGVYAALTTPFDSDGRIATERLRDNIERYNGTGLAGYLVLGSTGESVLLEDDESVELVKAVVAAAAPGKIVIAGTARESTRATIDFSNRVAGLGVRAALVRCPAYYKGRMNSEALKAHYLALADRSHIPVLVYNIPQNTGITIDPRLVVELAKHENIAGLKESFGSLGYLGEVVPRVKEDFCYLLGSGHVIYPGLEMGASGAILAVADVAPEICARIYDLFSRGDKDEARQLQFDLIPLNKATAQESGIPGLKAALDLRGWYGGPVRLPLLPADDKTRAEIAARLRDLGLA